jgi:hypothetical protein
MVNVFRTVVLSQFDNPDIVESLVRDTNPSDAAASGNVRRLPLPVATQNSSFAILDFSLVEAYYC